MSQSISQARSTNLKTDSAARATLSGHVDTAIKAESTSRKSLSGSVSTAVADLDLESEVGSDSVANNVAFHEVTFTQTFSAPPKIMGMLRNDADNGDPIVAVQLSGVSATGATFIFSDETPSANYNLDYIASL